MRWEQHAPALPRPSAPIVEQLCATPTRSVASCAVRPSVRAACHSIGPSIPGQPSPTSSRNHRGRKRRSITRQGYMRLICWTGGSGSLQRVRISMVSSATILVVLVVLFLVSIKWTIDVIGGWPHKIPISRYLEQQRSRPVTANRQPGGDSFFASVLAGGQRCASCNVTFCPGCSHSTTGSTRNLPSRVGAKNGPRRAPGCSP